MITKRHFQNYEGREVSAYTLHGEVITVEVLDFGATVRSVVVHGKRDTDVCLGFDSADEYAASGLYCGATVGRCANRIEGGRFTLNGQEYTLDRNDGGNHHHGGHCGFFRKQFEGRIDGDTLVLSLLSPDGDQGYPGNLEFTAAFTVTGGELKIVYTGKTDADTLFNPTSHCYFNLGGEGSGDISDTVLRIRADRYLPINGGVLPSGEIAPVENTPFDFRTPKPIGADINASDAQLKKADGYDHNYCISGGHYATAYSPRTGIIMDCYASAPGVQFYSGNFIRETTGKSRRVAPAGKIEGNNFIREMTGKSRRVAPAGKIEGNNFIRETTGKSRYLKRGGFCLEPQYYPNAINIPAFTPPVLKAGETGSVEIAYVFKLAARA